MAEPRTPTPLAVDQSQEALAPAVPGGRSHGVYAPASSGEGAVHGSVPTPSCCAQSNMPALCMKPESAYYESLHETPLIANTIARTAWPK